MESEELSTHEKSKIEGTGKGTIKSQWDFNFHPVYFIGGNSCPEIHCKLCEIIKYERKERGAKMRVLK